MAYRWKVCVVLVLVTSMQVSCVIWSHNQGQKKPKEIDFEKESTMMDKLDLPVKEARRLFQRSVNPHSIGHSEPLEGDGHTHALVHWTGYPSEYLFVLTRKRDRNSMSTESWLWRSTDYGHTFSNDTTKWNLDTVIEWYYIAPLSEYLIFSDRIHFVLWVTRDEGDTYTHHPLPFIPDNFRFQSRQVLGSNSSTLSQYVLGYASNSTLFISTNLGTSWTYLSDNVTRYYWRVLSPTFEDNTTVYYEKYINDTHSCLYVSQFPYNSSHLFPYLPPFLRNTFVLSNEYMFVQMSSVSGIGDQYRSPLFVSRNRESFRQARFPLQSQERHYAVVDSSEGQVFIAVYHNINNTNLYLSEVEGLNYSLSLTQIVSPPESEWSTRYPQFDVHVVEGVVGSYIVNTKVNGYGSTLISYDKGGNWVQLTPPAVDKNGNAVICQHPTCSLHLHIQSDSNVGYQSILTQDSAVGLIMGQGNLGRNLVNTRSELMLYFSRNGGLSWTEVNSGFWQFQFAGHGSIVVAIQMYQLTSSVQWSCDEGNSWTTVEFLEGSNYTSIAAVGMLTEQGEKALHVTVFGIENPFKKWIIIDLNFTSVLPNQCSQENFYDWIPTDERPGSRCLLGEVILYERRNSSNCCYVDPGYNRYVSRSPCNCTREDFECDFGFERIQLNSPCTPMRGFLWPPLQPTDCPGGTNYTISSGYRKIAGDECIRGNELSYFPLVRPCIVDPPEELSLVLDSTHISPNTPITFTLLQLEGGHVSTVYKWNFNDSTVITVISYTLAYIQVHTFTSPDIYNVSVMATNSGGFASITLPVTVYDVLVGVSIVPPVQLTSHQLPADLAVVFRSQVSTRFNTSRTGRIVYTWEFGDGHSSDPTSSNTITHTYRNSGNLTITLTVSVAGTSQQISNTLSFNVFEASDSSSVKIVNSGFVNDAYAVVGKSIKLSVESREGSGHMIPPGTQFTWHILPPDTSSCNETAIKSVPSTSPQYSVVFMCWGEYDISVVGNHSAGSFAPQIHITAEFPITSIAVSTSIPPVLRSGIYFPLSLISTTIGRSYQGPFGLNRIYLNGSITRLSFTPNSSGLVMVHVQLLREDSTTPSNQNLTLNGFNHVSSFISSLQVTLAVRGEYGELRFIFLTSLLPSSYNTTEWMNDLSTSLVSLLMSRYHLPSTSLEIENVGFGYETPKDELKRSVEDTIYVEINLFPKSIQTGEIQEIINVTLTILVDSRHGNLPAVVVGGVVLNMTVELRDSQPTIIIDLIPVIQPVNIKLYAGLGVGLGVGLIFVIIIAVSLGVTLYFYRRRYKRLNVRYSRLRQTPVRFTFNQGGEMVEDDDYEPGDDDVPGDDETTDFK